MISSQKQVIEETAGLTHVFYEDIHIMGHPFICDAVSTASCDLFACCR